jgi:hypothetical protein
VNESLRELETQGTIRVEYGGLRVLNLEALRSNKSQARPRAAAASVAIQ